MLEMRQFCECCGKRLAPDADAAFICSYECTFCRVCTDEVLANVCPNCGGNLTLRPFRSPERLARDPATTERIVKDAGCPKI